MTQTLTHNQAESAPDLSYKPFQRRNISSGALSFLAALFAVIAVLPLILVLGYVLVQGGSKISLALLRNCLRRQASNTAASPMRSLGPWW